MADTARTWHVIMLDTPGHVDFSAEMERTLQVLDYAILVISATDGVQGHTRTLWRLLKHYNVPTFIFVNKMDMQGTDAEKVQAELRSELSDGCVDFSSQDLFEELAMCSEPLLDEFMESPFCSKIRKKIYCIFCRLIVTERICSSLITLNKFRTSYSPW